MKESVKNIILKHVSSSRDYIELIDNRYIIPKYITGKGNRLIDLPNLRRELLVNQSSYSRNFKDYLDNLKIQYFQEHIILIRNQKLWNSIQSEFNISVERLYFSLDYYLPEYEIAVEIDSNLHDPNYDKARDEYIFRNYGVRTIRFMEFGENLYTKDIYNTEFINIISKEDTYKLSWNMYYNLRPIDDYIDIAFDNFLRDYKNELDILDKLINYFGYNNFCSNNIVITNYELVNICRNENSSIKVLIDRLFHGKLFTVLSGINSYKFQYIYNIIKNRYIFDWDKFIRKNKIIPYWIPQVIYDPVPNKYISLIQDMTEEDKYILLNVVNKITTFENPSNSYIWKDKPHPE